MEKLNELNKLLKKNFSIDLFNSKKTNNSNLARDILNDTEKYFINSITLEDVIKEVYGDNAEIITQDIILNSIPSNLKKKRNKNLIIDLANLGYDNVLIKYFVKIDDKKIELCDFNKNVKRYLQPISAVQYMDKIEKLFNVELIPDTRHVDIEYVDQYVEEHFASINHYGELEVVTTSRRTGKKEPIVNSDEFGIKTKEGKLLFKGIDTNHYNGYSSDLFNPNKVLINYNLRNNTIISDLTNVSSDFDSALKKAIYNKISKNEQPIIDIVINHIRKELNNKIEHYKRHFKECHSSFSYEFRSENDYWNSLEEECNHIIDICKNLEREVPEEEKDSKKLLLEILLCPKNIVSSKYEEVLNKLNQDKEEMERHVEYCEEMKKQLLSELEKCEERRKEAFYSYDMYSEYIITTKDGESDATIFSHLLKENSFSSEDFDKMMNLYGKVYSDFEKILTEDIKKLSKGIIKSIEENIAKIHVYTTRAKKIIASYDKITNSSEDYEYSYNDYSYTYINMTLSFIESNLDFARKILEEKYEYNEFLDERLANYATNYDHLNESLEEIIPHIEAAYKDKKEINNYIDILITLSSISEKYDIENISEYKQLCNIFNHLEELLNGDFFRKKDSSKKRVRK